MSRAISTLTASLLFAAVCHASPQSDAVLTPARSAGDDVRLVQEETERLSPAQWYSLRREARGHFNRGNYGAARPILERLHAMRPADPQITYWLAYSRLRVGDRKGALPLLESSFARGHGRLYLVAYDLAREYMAVGDRTKALHWLQESLGARYEERPAIGRDPAFAKLRSAPAFRALAGLLPTSTDQLSRVDGWRFDLDHYLSEVKRLHADPDSVGRTPAFALEIERLKERVADLTDIDVYVALQRLTVSLGDGHSTIYPAPTPRVRFVGLDIDIYWFSDGVFVLGGGEEVKPFAGAEVVAIGGKPIGKLLKELEPLIPLDNEHGLRWLAPTYARSPTVLRAIGRSENGLTADYTVRQKDGSERTVTVKSQRWLRPAKLGPPANRGAAPLYLSRVGTPHWHERLTESEALYVQVNQVTDGPGRTLAAFASALREELDKTGYEELVLDLRHNNGGDPDLLRPLVRALVHFSMESPNHRLFVIVGRNTFSAAQNFCNAIEQWTDAVFVGEPSSSCPNSIGEETSVRLPWSGLMATISSRYFQDSAPTDHRPWIPIAIPVALSSADYFANRDPAIEAVLDVIRGDRK